MNVLMLCYEYPPLGGGGAKVVDGLTKELVREGHNVDLVTMGYKGLKNKEKKGSLTIYRSSWKRRDPQTCTPPVMFIYLLTAFPLIIELCRRKKYDMNHTHFIFPDGVLALMTKIVFHLPLLITAHGSDVPGYNPHRFITLHKWLTPIWKRIIKSADGLIFPSRHLRDLAFKIRSDLPNKVLPNGFDPDRFSPDQKKEKRILVVSRMFERKGVQFFLLALKELEHNYKITIVGDGPYLITLKELATSLKIKVEFLGDLDNQSRRLKDLYERSSIFVFTSEAENFPIVLLEAMASGLAIITTSKTGCAEVVGEAALMVNPKDPISLRKALIKYMNNPNLRDQMRRKARKRLVENFDWKIIAARHIELYYTIKGNN